MAPPPIGRRLPASQEEGLFAVFAARRAWPSPAEPSRTQPSPAEPHARAAERASERASGPGPRRRRRPRGRRCRLAADRPRQRPPRSRRGGSGRHRLRGRGGGLGEGTSTPARLLPPPAHRLLSLSRRPASHCLDPPAGAHRAQLRLRTTGGYLHSQESLSVWTGQPPWKAD
ncbi:PREDICTED: adropin isoform X1 [Hipposideros armiger]|uniref:Adropin isoform X1 n=1 Tax=Hipposideros armiger TaxID=186990 RepID=A0A8B7PUU5_HIPAR|nr:PREDICTED: adropin isoform X1 [Hipposideros armiger]